MILTPCPRLRSQLLPIASAWARALAYVRAAARALACLLFHATLAQAQGSDPDTTSVRPHRCSIRTIDSSFVRIGDSLSVLLEPNTVAYAGRNLLVAGTSNYLSRSIAEGEVYTVEDSIFGVIRTPSGRWSIVPLPKGIRYLAGARAVGRPDGRWDVIGVQLDSAMSLQRGLESTVAAWYGIVSVKGWEHLERLPVGHPTTMEYINSSALVRRGDTLTWAVHVRGEGMGVAGSAAVLESIRGRWSYRLLGDHTLSVHMAQLKNGDRRLFLRRESAFMSSKFQIAAFAFRPTPAPVDTLVVADTLNRFRLRMYRTPDGRLSFNFDEPRPDRSSVRRSISLDTLGRVDGRRTLPFDYVRHVPLRTAPGDAPWLFLGDKRDAEHPDASGGHLELAFATPTTAWRDASVPHVFIAPPATTVLREGLLELTGPVLSLPKSGARLETLVATVGYRCRD